MNSFHTTFGTLQDYQKGGIEIVADNPKYYAFSNIFEVANKSAPYEKVAVALNLGYVYEALRIEGQSVWYAAPHDEFAIVMDGEVEVQFIKLADPAAIYSDDSKGSVPLAEQPAGQPMGRVVARRGHQVLLPEGSAYRFTARAIGVMLLQTMDGPATVHKWAEICLK